MPRILGAVIAVSACLMASPQATYAQTYADLELVVSSPTNNQVIPFGDTLHTTFFIINHGPDPIVNDTLIISNNLDPVTSGFVGSIAVGDTGVCHGIVQGANPGSDTDTLSVCYYFPAVVSLSNDVVDTNATNDTACVSYVMLGDPNTGIADFSSHTTLELYPNPAKEVLRIKFPQIKNQKCSFRIYDILGREKGAFSSLKRNLGVYTLSLNGLSDGIYMLEADCGKTSYHCKFVVSKT